MSTIKKIIYLLLIQFLFIQCKAYQVNSKRNEMEYNTYRIQQKFWNSPNGKIAYIDKGEGKPLLLLHGVPTSGWLYRKMIDPLVEKGYRVIVPDMLGFGNSDSPDGYDVYDKANHAKRIIGLMNYLNINNWHHVMHDAGGLWTWELFKQDPNKIYRLTILNTIIYKEGFNPPVNMKQGNMAKLAMWSYRNFTQMSLKMLFKNGTDTIKMSKADIEGYAMPFKEGKTKALYKFFTTNTKSIPNYSSVIKQINIPTQVIWGINDTILLWNKDKELVIKDLKIKSENIHILNKNHFLQEESAANLIEIIGVFK